MRAAIYARFSTEKQNAKSTADQRRLCESHLPAGAKVVAFHADEAVSGSVPVMRRPGGRALIADVLAKRVDLILVESLDRISRDQVDLEATVRRIEHNGARIIGVSDGYDSAAGGRKVLRTVRGLVGEMYLDDLREKTHRGLAGRAIAGHAVTQPSYGYRIERGDDGSRFVVDPAQAAVVREIFAAYAAGKGLHAIVEDLNSRSVPTPRGNAWTVSALYGSPLKGAGILNNSMYIGRTIWNRSQWLKDPDTGKRQRIDRPRSEWIESEAPELRIVDDAMWAKARARIDAGRDENGRKRAGRPTRTIFGGLLRCPNCGGPMIAVDSRTYGCARRKNSGPSVCAGFTLRRKDVDEGLLSMLRVMLERPDFADDFQRELRAQLSDEVGERAQIAERLRVLDTQIGRLVEAIATVGVSASLAERLKAAEAEREALRERQAATPARVDLRAVWEQVKGNLSAMLAAADPEEARAAVAELLEPVFLKVDPATGQTWGTVILRGLASGGAEPAPRKRRRPDGSEPAPLIVVAGARSLYYRQRVRFG